jgi:hypothetical protein
MGDEVVIDTVTTKDVVKLSELSAETAEHVRRLLAEDEARAKESAKWDPEARPQYCFSRQTPARNEGADVRIRNGLDEDGRWGTIVRQVGRAWVVRVGWVELLVHEPDDTWLS